MTKLKNLLDGLRSDGKRITAQRIAICELLAGTNAHPTAQEIFTTLQPRFPTLSLATVYNTLETLINLGAINALGSAGDDAVHYDADTSPHVNLACIRCHKVSDLGSEHIHHVAAEIEESSRYRLLGARVVYYGICPDCQSISSIN